MKKTKLSKPAAIAIALPLAFGMGTVAVAHPLLAPVVAASSVSQNDAVVSVSVTGPTTVLIKLADNKEATLDFYGDNIFRFFRDDAGGKLRDPKSNPPAQILVDNPRKDVTALNVVKREDNGTFDIETKKVRISINQKTGLMKIVNTVTGQTVLEETAPAVIEKNHSSLSLKAGADEYFYGGGMQNGRFSHKGKAIQIVNSNNWTDGGVASPAPFYWSTAGYGIMWYTFKPGRYDFASEKNDLVTVMHEEDYIDLFIMVDQTPVQLLNDYYQLTGNPVLLPKFGFYEGHLNAYNRDYWKEASKPGEGTPFEDGKNYVESQKDNGGIKESLNGEKNNYQFSARAVVDRYAAHDYPLGWVLPNDGYGAGYGQTNTLDGNIQNLKEFGDYARSKGVEIGLWTQSDLHPKEGVEPLLQRDIVKEVGTAGVRVLKTDVAWVGAGYSFGLNGVADVAKIMPQYGNSARPFIITLDGWAGTQRYAGLWSGDQTGGNWEYIRFHIPTYIGSGLSGQPNVSSDMDGIFGGKNVAVNIRDFQWKTFTPMELNMDGWGANAKYPHILGEPAASINRMYLKMKSELLPYTYSIAHEAVTGKPIVSAMFMYYPNAYTLGKATQYQFMYGPNFLVAPIYQDTKMNKDTYADVRNGIYLPEGMWIDYFNGNCYEGGRIINNYDAPAWKLPVFVKSGAIIPMTYANNNPNQIKKDARVYEIYPTASSAFTEYDDDGWSTAYLKGEHATTEISTELDKNELTVNIAPTQGKFNGQVINKATELRINVTAQPKKVSAKVGKKKVKLREAKTLDEFNNGSNVYYYDAAPNLNRFATKGSEFEKVELKKNPQLLVKLAATDVTANATEVTVKGIVFDTTDKQLTHTGELTAPKAVLTDENIKPYTLTPTWEPVANADYYEIEFNGMIYSTITDTQLLFEDLKAETSYSFKVRAVNKDGKSAWTSLQATTKSNPLEFAIKGIKATTTCENQGGQGVDKLFNFDETDAWHSKWGKGEAIPFDMDIDLRSINNIDKLQYIPREDAGNGTLLKGTISYSLDKEKWSTPIPFEWAKNGEMKEVKFTEKPQVQYLKIHVDEAVNNFASGSEMYIFKVPGTETILPGDINHDQKIDMDDFTSYMNYTGLRKGDSDFDGYVSGGDINHNGLIDAYDISVVGTQVRGGVDLYGMQKLSGSLVLTPNKTSYAAGDEVLITVKSKDLQAVNALSFGLPYDTRVLEYTGIDVKNMKDMENLTNDRLHTNGQKALYPTFVNTGDKDVLEGSDVLFVLKFKAKKSFKFNLKAVDGMLVDKALNTLKF